MRNSAAHGWTDLYFERRDDSLFHTAEHAIDGHYLMVKLNPLSIAERRIDGKRHTEVQRRGSTAYVPSGCGHSVRYVRPLGSLCLMTLPEDTLREVADELGVARIAMAPAFAEAPDHFVLNAFETLDRELQDGNPHGALIGQTYARTVAAHVLTCHGGAGARRDGRPAALTAARIQRLDEYIEARIAARSHWKSWRGWRPSVPSIFARVQGRDRAVSLPVRAAQAHRVCLRLAAAGRTRDGRHRDGMRLLRRRAVLQAVQEDPRHRAIGVSRRLARAGGMAACPAARRRALVH